ncbi:MAG: YkgJ family cysteine cluster protein [Candidatus Coatesbacteria bacterium]|nr:YkgJ family cysteine cluster protein [Candidatus Coatesbacteria bacterium]
MSFRKLRFRCIQCGACCRVEDGMVYITAIDEKSIAKHLSLPLFKFRRKYVTTDPEYFNKKCLKNEDDGNCPFFVENKCSIYEVRPLQCRSFPFWPEFMKEENGIKKLLELCPGFGKGKLYSKEEIEAIITEVIKAAI